jgi:hypothetical protein
MLVVQTSFRGMTCPKSMHFGMTGHTGFAESLEGQVPVIVMVIKRAL